MRHPVLEQEGKKKRQTEEQDKFVLFNTRVKLECIIRWLLSKIRGSSKISWSIQGPSKHSLWDKAPFLWTRKGIMTLQSQEVQSLMVSWEGKRN